MSQFIHVYETSKNLGDCLFKDILESKLNLALYNIEIRKDGQTLASSAHGFLRSIQGTVILEILDTNDNPMVAHGFKAEKVPGGTMYIPQAQVGELQSIETDSHEITGQSFNGYKFRLRELSPGLNSNSEGHCHWTVVPHQITFERDETASIIEYKRVFGEDFPRAAGSPGDTRRFYHGQFPNWLLSTQELSFCDSPGTIQCRNFDPNICMVNLVSPQAQGPRLELFDLLQDAISFVSGRWTYPLLEISNDGHLTTVQLYPQAFITPEMRGKSPVPVHCAGLAFAQLAAKWKANCKLNDEQQKLLVAVRQGIIRVLESSDRSINVQEFVVTTTIEGICNLYDKINKPPKDRELRKLINKAKNLITTTYSDEFGIQNVGRLTKYLENMQPRNTKSRLDSVFKTFDCVLPGFFWEAWTGTRVPMAHGYAQDFDQARIDNLMTCYELWHVIVLGLSGYLGRFIRYGSRGGAAYPSAAVSDIVAGWKGAASSKGPKSKEM